jgi:hypothetical protein
MDMEKKFQVLNDGRMAHLAREEVSRFIDEQKTRKILELSRDFRMGKIDQASLLSSVAAFCALEDLENEMKRKILKGQQAAVEINKEQKV